MDDLNKELSKAYLDVQSGNLIHQVLSPIVNSYNAYQQEQAQKQQRLADLMSNKADSFYSGMPLNGVCPTCGRPF